MVSGREGTHHIAEVALRRLKPIFRFLAWCSAQWGNGGGKG